MKAIVRNVLFACLVSGFALFGMLGSTRQAAPASMHSLADKPLITELQKENLTCIGLALLAWVLCVWRCAVLNRRLNNEREYQRRFNDYMRASALNRHYY